MSFFRSIATRYRKQCETNETHWDEELRTRYYKANFNQMFQSVEQILQEGQSYKITSVSKDHGEISAEINSGFPIFLIATIITVKPYQTAVDFHLSTERFSITGAGPILKKEVLRLYEKLGQAHTYIGAGKTGKA